MVINNTKSQESSAFGDVNNTTHSPDDVRRIHERRLKERKEFVDAMTRFKHKDLETMVNYRTKSGLLGRVDRVATRLEAEEMLLRQAEADLSQDKISRELGGLPGETAGGVDVGADGGGDSGGGDPGDSGGGFAPSAQVVAGDLVDPVAARIWSQRD